MFTRQDFHFDLPAELIAQTPAKNRSASRLLVLDNQQLQDKNFTDLLDFIEPDDLLVFNNTKVIPARLFGQKPTGGKVEVLIERVLLPNQAWCHVRANKSPKINSQIAIAEDLILTVIDRADALFLLEFPASKTPFEWLEIYGHMPLPPYITRSDSEQDQTRYQTVYGEHLGAVAAPTAGLHFEQATLQALKAKGADLGFVTLHVGAGTFKPVQVDSIADHKMHAEWFEVQPGLVAQVKQAKAKGGRVIAVGTTSVRCLESASRNGELQAMQGDTEIFITPGYEFQQVDVLITNFHLPESTLIMLVSAFAGFENTMRAYQHAVEQQYRFFSYGDSMLIFKEKLNEI